MLNERITILINKYSGPGIFSTFKTSAPDAPSSPPCPDVVTHCAGCTLKATNMGVLGGGVTFNTPLKLHETAPCPQHFCLFHYVISTEICANQVLRYQSFTPGVGKVVFFCMRGPKFSSCRKNRFFFFFLKKNTLIFTGLLYETYQEKDGLEDNSILFCGKGKRKFRRMIHLR